MIRSISETAVRARWAAVFVTLVVAAIGVWNIVRLPIDAVPDITNKQVQINTVAPEFGPLDIERLVTYPVETALSGIVGLESTRSISRNGFSQVTAVFRDDVDVYFARQQVAERLVLATAAREVFDGVVDLVLEETLQPAEVDEVADRIRAPAVPDEITNRRAIRIAARQRREILEAQPPARLPHRREQNVCGVQSGRSRRQETLISMRVEIRLHTSAPANETMAAQFHCSPPAGAVVVMVC